MVLLNDKRRIRSDEEVLKTLNLETYDIMTSSDFQFCLDSLVKLMSDQFLESLSSSLVQQLVCNNVSEIAEKPIFIKLPFARVIPIMNKSNLILETNMIKNRILNNKLLNRFSENIYESYSIANREISQQNYMNASYNEDSMVNQVS